jgi:hypothetical protein
MTVKMSILFFWVVTAFIFRVEVSPEDGGSMFVRKVGIYLQVHMAFLPRTQKTSIDSVLKYS